MEFGFGNPNFGYENPKFGFGNPKFGFGNPKFAICNPVANCNHPPAPCINGYWIRKSKIWKFGNPKFAICNPVANCNHPPAPCINGPAAQRDPEQRKRLRVKWIATVGNVCRGPQPDSLASLCVCLARRRPWTTPRNVQAVQTLSGTHLITRVTKTPHISATDPCVQKEIAFVVAWQRLTKLLSEALWLA